MGSLNGAERKAVEGSSETALEIGLMGMKAPHEIEAENGVSRALAQTAAWTQFSCKGHFRVSPRVWLPVSEVGANGRVCSIGGRGHI